MKRTSLNDIADQLGVSRTLVSAVLNGRGKEYRISEAMCEKVIALAKELNYKPNHFAKSLRTGKTNTIALMMPDISNPFFGKFGREVVKEAVRYGYKVIFSSSDESHASFKQQLEMLLHGAVDGFIIFPTVDSQEQIRLLESNHVPYVLIDRFFSEIDSNYIILDNYGASYEATKHLISNGFSRIAFVSFDIDLDNMKERLRGYEGALFDSGMEIEKGRIKILPFSHEFSNVQNAIEELILDKENETEAILFATSKLGIMGLQAIGMMDKRVPDDVAIVSFDDPDAYRICQSPITALAHPIEEIGKQSVGILMDLFSDNAINLERKKIVLKSKLIVRKSSAI